MALHYISFSRPTPQGRIRIQFVIRAETQKNARRTAQAEKKRGLKDYRYQGAD